MGEEDALSSQLAFLRGPAATRETAGRAFGAPTVAFEQGRIVAYTLYLDLDRQLTTKRSRSIACYGLMIEFGQLDQVVRHALIRDGSPDCSKS